MSGTAIAIARYGGWEVIKRKLALIALLLLAVIALFRSQHGLNQIFETIPQCSKTGFGACNPRGLFAAPPQQEPKMQSRQLAGTLGIGPGRFKPETQPETKQEAEPSPQATLETPNSTDFIAQDQVIVHLSDR